MEKTNSKYKRTLIASVCIFGTVGIFRRYIPLSSGMTAFVRGILGAAFLLLTGIVRKQKLNFADIYRNFLPLLISGAAIGFNWILLFEAYNYTTVAIATLCYYLAPILVILAAPMVLKTKLTGKKAICAAVALVGMVFVSGVTQSGFSGAAEWKGILYGIGAAVLYACVILTNQKIRSISPEDRTVVQLAVAALSLLPYLLVTEGLSIPVLSPLPLVLLVVTGIVHTGFAYKLYFGSMEKLEAHTIALYSYIDPILAIFLSAVLLKEPLTLSTMVGAVLILGAAYCSEK